MFGEAANVGRTYDKAMATRTGRKPQKRGAWQERHLSCCLACGRVWKPARRKTCPNGCRDLRICLTCDRVWPEDQVRGDLERRCAPPAEDLRDFVRQCGGDWDTAKRRLIAANGDLARAVVALDRSQGRNVFTDDASGDQPKPLPGPRPPGDLPELDDEEYDTFARSGRDPRAVQELRAERRREESY